MQITSSTFIELFNREQRVNIIAPDARREVDGTVIRHVSNLPGGGSFVLFSALDEISVDTAIQRQVDYFRGIGESFEWKVYSFDTPADLHERLARHGFSIGEEEKILVLDMENVPAALLAPPRHTVKKITTVETLEDVFVVERKVWAQKTGRISEFLRAALTDFPDEMSIYVAYEDGNPASAGWIDFSPNSQFAGLWGGSTVPKYRRRGVYRALLAARVQEARARGRRYITVDASPMSRPILERLGFQCIGSTWPCEIEF